MAIFQNTSDKAKNTAKDVADEAIDLGEVLKEKALDVGVALRDKAADMGKEALDKGRSIQDQVVEYVAENPLKSLGLAFILGICFAKRGNSK